MSHDHYGGAKSRGGMRAGNGNDYGEGSKAIPTHIWTTCRSSHTVCSRDRKADIIAITSYLILSSVLLLVHLICAGSVVILKPNLVG